MRPVHLAIMMQAMVELNATVSDKYNVRSRFLSPVPTLGLLWIQYTLFVLLAESISSQMSKEDSK